MKKKLSIFLVAAMAAVMLTGCGGTGSEPTAGSGVSDTSVVSSTPEEEETADGSAEESSETAESAEPEESSDVSAAESSDESKAESSKAESSKAVSEAQSSSTPSTSTPSQTGSTQSSRTETVSQPTETSSSTVSKPSGSGSTTTSKPTETSSSTVSKPSGSGSTTTSKPTETSSSTVSKPSGSGSATTSKPTETSSTSSKPSSSGSTTTSKPSETSSTTSKPSTAASTLIGDEALYEQLFSLDNKVTIQITMSKSEMDKMNSDYYKYKNKGSKSPIYRKADVVITVGSKSYTIEEVGIRPKGNTSIVPVYDNDTGKLNLSHYKLSFAETFDDKTYYGSDAKVWASSDERKARKNRRFATLKKLDVKWNRNYDETYIREIYASRIFKDSGVLSQKIGLTQLKFNGENYGVMTIYEPVDKIFLERYLPKEALGGDLYKVGWTNSPANYVSGQVTMGVEDNDKGKKYNFNLKTNEETSKHESLKNFIKVINSNPTLSQLEKVVDTDYFAKFLAASYFVGDPDDIRNNYNNHYIYFRKDNGKAIFILYDNDRTLGITRGYNPDGTGMTGQSPYSMRAAGAGNTQANPLIKLAIQSNGILRDKYTAALKQVAKSSLWDISNFEKEYNKAKNNYQSYVTPSVSFANVRHTFRFSLDGRYTSGTDANMSFSEYVTRIMKTYNAAVSN